MVRVKPNVVIDDKALLCRAQVEIARLKRLLRYVMSGSGHEKASAQSEAGGATVVEAMAAGAAVSGAVGVQEEEAVAAESEMIRLLDENEKLRNENIELKRKLAKFQARLNLQHTPGHRPGVWSPVKKPPQQSSGLGAHTRKSLHQSPGKISARPFSSLDNSPYAVVRSMTSVSVKREPSPRRPKVPPPQPPPEQAVDVAMAKATAPQLMPIAEKKSETAVVDDPLISHVRIAVEPADRATADEAEVGGSPLRGAVRRRRKDRNNRLLSPAAKLKSVEAGPDAGVEESGPAKLSIDTSAEINHQQSALSAYLPRGMRIGGGLVARLTTPILRNRAYVGKSGTKTKRKKKARPASEDSDSEASGSPHKEPVESASKPSPSKQLLVTGNADVTNNTIGNSIESIVDKLAGMTDRGERAKILGECIDWCAAFHNHLYMLDHNISS
jgi:hypothetical protein